MKNAYFFLNGDDFSIFFLAWQIGNKQTKHKLFILLHSEWINLHSEWRFLHSFFFRSVLNLFLKKISTENFLHLKWRNLHSEWRFLHSNVFQKRFELFFEKNIYREFSPFRMEISPFIFFRSVLNFFFEKQTPQIIFSIQNGEISILNGDLSIYFFSEAFWTLFWKKLCREFSPFRMEKSPFWMEISPFKCFSDVFWTLKKKNSAESFLRSEWRNLHSEWRSPFIFFRNVFLLKNKLHSEWRHLHSEWRFLHSNVFFRSVLNIFLKKISIYRVFFHSELRLLHSNRRFLYSFKRIIFLYSEFSILI